MNKLFVSHGHYILYILVIGVIFRSWFSLTPLSSGDWEYYFPEALRFFPVIPNTWNNSFGIGFGGNQTFFMIPHSFFVTSASLLFAIFGFKWNIIERVVWFYPFLIVASISSFLLFKTVFPNLKKYALFSAFFYLCNSYILMIVGGGQMGIAMAYAFLPLVLSTAIFLTRAIKTREFLVRVCFFILAFSCLLLFDVRVFYIAWLIVGLYFIFSIISKIKKTPLKKNIQYVVFFFIIPILGIVLLHNWWILPFLSSSQTPISSFSETNDTALKFFSFAKFQDSISLLHANWPENIFGKVSFLRPEFLVLPVLAFGSLMFLTKKTARSVSNYVLFFITLALIGIFLAKGTNDPFGIVYSILFNHLPRFSIFASFPSNPMFIGSIQDK